MRHIHGQTISTFGGVRHLRQVHRSRFENRCHHLEESQKLILTKIWKVLTYKWQLQILFNLPFLVWWIMDISIVKVHEFDLKLLSYLNLPDWLLSLMGFGQLST